MWRQIHKIATGLIITLGALHCGFTAIDYSSFSLEAMWFLGTGVAIILAGFLNVAAVRVDGKDKVIKYLCLAVNLFFAVLFVIALSLLAQLQVFVGVAVFGAASLAITLGERQ